MEMEIMYWLKFYFLQVANVLPHLETEQQFMTPWLYSTLV